MSRRQKLLSRLAASTPTDRAARCCASAADRRSCRGNGKDGAYAGIGVYWPDEDTLCVRAHAPRADRAAILPSDCPASARQISGLSYGYADVAAASLIRQAVMRALETDPSPTEPLNIRTDSSYAIDCAPPPSPLV